MNHSNPKTLLTALVLAFGSPALVACSDAQPPGDVQQTGTLTAALLTSSADGAIYQFPAGTLLTLIQGNYRQDVPIDGSETSLTVPVPVGTIEVQLQFANGTPQLRRTIGGVTTLVNASWVDVQPVLVPIGANQFSDLPLHFLVTGLGDITFDMGNLVVALDVQRASTAQPAELLQNGSYIHSFQLFGANTTTAAQAYFAQTAGDSHQHAYDFNFTGPWAQTNATMVCAPTTLDAFSTLDGESGYSRATNLLIGQAGVACIVDAGLNDQLFVNAALVGPAPAPLQSALPSDNYRFFVSVSGFVGDVYNGQTFQQSVLESATQISGGVLAHQIFDLELNEQTLYQEGFLSGRMQLVP